VTVDLAAPGFCDASGRGALVRMASHARQLGRPFRLTSPSPSLVKIMRITGLDRKFLAPQTPPAALAADLRSPSPFGPHNALLCTPPLARHKPAAAVQADTDREGMADG
jgi:hypothetical protein